MAQAMASMTGLQGTAGSARLLNNGTRARQAFIVRASSADQTETSRRAMLGLVAAGIASGSFAQAVLAEAKSIKVGGPPPPSGGLTGTNNSDQARDLGLPLKSRFYLQPLPPAEAAVRAKESAKEILAVKPLIDKKAWPYVQNDLRTKGSYLRYDLNTVISAKPKPEKDSLKSLTGKLFETLNNLDYAAKVKNSDDAQKYYEQTVSDLNNVLATLG